MKDLPLKEVKMLNYMKGKNVVLKFRKFWKELDGLERSHLWDIMTALRGADVGSDHVKMFTTARIRGELLGRDFYKGFVFLSLERAKYHQGNGYSPSRIVKQFRAEKSHFVCHVIEAIETLAKYRPKTSVRDLLKFTRTRG